MASTHLTISDGLLVLIEGNKRGGREWFTAYKWQQDAFIKAMKFGTMKSMCYPNPRTETEPFKHRGINYRFIIINDWGPCFLKNMDSGTEREIKYFEINKHNSREANFSPVQIKKTY